MTQDNQWWKETATGDGYWCDLGDGKEMLIVPKDKDAFYSQFLKNLETSQNSPFEISINVTSVEET